MENIILNDNNLCDDEMDLKVVRVKALMINSKGKILLAHNNNTYQFPGGHLEDNEEIDKCILREIKEETGIKITELDPPFLTITTYDDNYFGTSRKVLNKIYYYRIFTDETPNFNETHYDALELETDFDLYYVNFNDLDSFLNKCLLEGSVDEKIAREMLLVYSKYQEIFGGNE